jgi:hypothetical protein
VNLDTMKRIARAVVPASKPEGQEKDWRKTQKLRAWPVLIAKSEDIRERGLVLRRIEIVGGGHETQLVQAQKSDGRSLSKRLRAIALNLRERINAGRRKAGVKPKTFAAPAVEASSIQKRIDASVKRAVKLGLGKLSRRQA